MDKGYIYQDVRYLISEYFEIKIRKIDKKTIYSKLNLKKSIKGFCLLLEKDFRIRITEEETKKAATIADLVEMIYKKMEKEEL